MKYIILPIVKFIWAIALTIFCTFVLTLTCLIKFVWYFETLPEDYFEVKYLQSGEGFWYSSYVLESECKYKHWYVFRSVFHFIWGLPPMEVFPK